MENTVAEKETQQQEVERPVGVRFKPCGRVYIFDARDLNVHPGDRVVVESMFGLTLGTVVKEFKKEEVNLEGKEIKQIVRIATDEDFKNARENEPLQEEAFKFCLERIKARGLPMKLVGTEATLDRRRIIFYFTADGRIDFRELVKDLAAKFKTRIEMRQIGVRDEAKLIGGIGICGRVLCCNSFLSEFVPISIKMAKDQELVLNTSKLTGLCGRLMCCLSYEYEGKIEGEDEIITEDMEGCLCNECPQTQPSQDPLHETSIESQELGPEPEPVQPEEEPVLKTVKDREPETEQTPADRDTQKEALRTEPSRRQDTKREETGERPARKDKKPSHKMEKKRHKKKKRHGRHKKKKRGKR
ncbi:MAG: stage 0 sporulation protein [Nitrospirae bacterium]|nr:stage 0 sporulation protein [Nitrospirota bacterium]